MIKGLLIWVKTHIVSDAMSYLHYSNIFLTNDKFRFCDLRINGYFLYKLFFIVVNISKGVLIICQLQVIFRFSRKKRNKKSFFF